MHSETATVIGFTMLSIFCRTRALFIFFSLLYLLRPFSLLIWLEAFVFLGTVTYMTHSHITWTFGFIWTKWRDAWYAFDFFHSLVFLHSLAVYWNAFSGNEALALRHSEFIEYVYALKFGKREKPNKLNNLFGWNLICSLCLNEY